MVYIFIVIYIMYMYIFEQYSITESNDYLDTMDSACSLKSFWMIHKTINHLFVNYTGFAVGFWFTKNDRFIRVICLFQVWCPFEHAKSVFNFFIYLYKYIRFRPKVWVSRSEGEKHLICDNEIICKHCVIDFPLWIPK